MIVPLGCETGYGDSGRYPVVIDHAAGNASGDRDYRGAGGVDAWRGPAAPRLFLLIAAMCPTSIPKKTLTQNRHYRLEVSETALFRSLHPLPSFAR